MIGRVSIPRHRSDGVVGTYREAFRVFRAHPLALLGPGLVFFAAFSVPQAFLEGALEDVEEVTAVDVGGVALVLVISFVTSYLYYGYCEEVFEQARHGPVSIRRALSATLPVLPALVVGSVLVALGVLVGLAMAILPGLWLLTRWAVVAPVVSYERTGPLRALRRSNALAAGRMRFVLLTAIAAVVGEELLAAGAAGLGEFLIANPVVQHAAEIVVDAVLSPLGGLVVAASYFRLREDCGEQETGAADPGPSADAPARSDKQQ